MSSTPAIAAILSILCLVYCQFCCTKLSISISSSLCFLSRSELFLFSFLCFGSVLPLFDVFGRLLIWSFAYPRVLPQNVLQLLQAISIILLLTAITLRGKNEFTAARDSAFLSIAQPLFEQYWYPFCL